MPTTERPDPRPTRPHRRVLVLALVVAMLASACGGGDSSSAAGAPDGLADSRPVCDQQPNPGADRITEGGPSSVVFYVNDDGWQFQGWGPDLPEEYRAETFESAAAVGCLAVLEEGSTRECIFEEDEGTFVLEVKGADYQFTMMEGATGDLLTTAMVTAEPGECPSSAFFTDERETAWASPVAELLPLIERELGGTTGETEAPAASTPSESATPVAASPAVSESATPAAADAGSTAGATSAASTATAEDLLQKILAEFPDEVDVETLPAEPDPRSGTLGECAPTAAAARDAIDAATTDQARAGVQVVGDGPFPASGRIHVQVVDQPLVEAYLAAVQDMDDNVLDCMAEAYETGVLGTFEGQSVVSTHVGPSPRFGPAATSVSFSSVLDTVHDSGQRIVIALDQVLVGGDGVLTTLQLQGDGLGSFPALRLRSVVEASAAS